MGDERILRKMAHEAIRAGDMPTCGPERLWGGPGNGARCAICGSTVGRDETEFELEFRLDVDRGRGNYHVHARCFAAWELERQEPQKAGIPGNEARRPAREWPGSNASGVMGGQSLPGGDNGATIADRESDTAFKRGSA